MTGSIDAVSVFSAITAVESYAASVGQPSTFNIGLIAGNRSTAGVMVASLAFLAADPAARQIHTFAKPVCVAGFPLAAGAARLSGLGIRAAKAAGAIGIVGRILASGKKKERKADQNARDLIPSHSHTSPVGIEYHPQIGRIIHVPIYSPGHPNHKATCMPLDYYHYCSYFSTT